MNESERERRKACHHLCSVVPVSHERAHERRVLSLPTDTQISHIMQRETFSNPPTTPLGSSLGWGGVCVCVGGVPGGVGVDGDDVVCQCFHCRPARAASQREGKIMMVSEKVTLVWEIGALSALIGRFKSDTNGAVVSLSRRDTLSDVQDLKHEKVCTLDELTGK